MTAPVPPAGPVSPVARAGARLRSMPVTVDAALVLLVVSIWWGVVELPSAIAGITGPTPLTPQEPAAGEMLIEALAVVLLALPTVLVILAWALLAAGRGWCWIPLAVLTALRLAVVLSGSDEALFPLLIVVAPLVLVLLPPSRAWFAARRAERLGASPPRPAR